MSLKQKRAARKKPGTGGSGKFYRIVVRPKEDFVTFRNQISLKNPHPPLQ